MTTPDEQRVKSRHEIARLDVVAHAAASDPRAALDALPWLGAAIDADAAAGRFVTWGRSTAIDENTGTAVVPAPVFEALHSRAGIDAHFPVGNAGLLHVYGYLLSTEPTPYGLKRERWLDGTLAQAYGLAADAFHPWVVAEDDTLLVRVTNATTALLSREPARRERIGDTEALIAIGRHAASDPSGPSALVYALVHGEERRLITTFPVADPAAVLTSVAQDGPRLRWNAVA
ncbi:amino acid deaminase [Microbacterium sp. VKM Ac-2870]|uniref:amino acid deaminase n=1 Tax=Microbacterium sp. VKM Ac-2870 TaxID=2783825 RepID=UPI001E381458|nr:amino acid deaminase [Microbacterium sp. VKM Ac-2870]